MRGHTYFELAMRYEVDLCADLCIRPGHRRGWVDDNGMVHWNPFRAVRRSTLRRFLMLVSESHQTNSDTPRHDSEAVRLYSASVFASKTALNDLGIRLPAFLAQTDKARVRAMLTGAPAELRRSKVGRWAGLR